MTLRQEALAAIDAKTKPPGSLGRIEELAVELAVLQDTLTPSVDPARVIIFGADHGVAAEGVSAYPSVVTAQMMANLASGGAAAWVFARTLDLSVEIVDVGVAADLSGLGGIVHAKVRPGTANFTTGPAMTSHDLATAIDAGRACSPARRWGRLPRAGARGNGDREYHHGGGARVGADWCFARADCGARYRNRRLVLVHKREVVARASRSTSGRD